MRTGLVVCMALLFCAMAMAQESHPHVTILEPPGNGLRLQAYSDAAPTAFASVLSNPDLAPLEPFSFVLTNTSSRTVVGLTIRWIVTDTSHKESIMDYRTDSFFLVRRPVLAGHSSLLVTPGTLIPENTGFIGPGKDERLLQRLQNSSSVTVYVDTAIFDDGQVVGRDRSHTVEHIRARKVASDELATALSQAIDKAEDTSQLLTRFVGARPDRKDMVAVWKMRIAQRLLRSRNLSKDVEALRNVPVPNLVSASAE